jgi:hypothetical protein
LRQAVRDFRIVRRQRRVERQRVMKNLGGKVLDRVTKMLPIMMFQRRYFRMCWNFRNFQESRRAGLRLPFWGI